MSTILITDIIHALNTVKKYYSLIEHSLAANKVIVYFTTLACSCIYTLLIESNNKHMSTPDINKYLTC